MIDTCVVVSALRSKRGASNRVLQLVLAGQLLAVCHYKLLAEYHDVLMRMVKSGSLTFSARQVERFVGVCEEVEVRYLWAQSS